MYMKPLLKRIAVSGVTVSFLLSTTIFARAEDASTPSSQDSSSPISLTWARPERPGDGVEVRVKLGNNLAYTYTRGGVTLKKTSKVSKVAADLIMTYLPVDNRRDSARVRVVVKSLQGSGFPFKSPAIVRCQGATVIVGIGPSVTYKRTDGKPMTEADRVYLGTIFRPAAAHAENEQEMVGVDHPVKLGDSWPMDKDKMAALVFKNDRIRIDPNGTKATVTFAKRGPMLGLDTATIAVNLRSEEIRVPDIASNLSDPSGTLAMKVMLYLPVDPGKPALGRISNTTINYTGIIRNAGVEGILYHADLEYTQDYSVVRIINGAIASAPEPGGIPGVHSSRSQGI